MSALYLGGTFLCACTGSPLVMLLWLVGAPIVITALTPEESP